MDLLDGSGFWDWTDGGVAPPTPAGPSNDGGGGDFPTRVQWRQDVLDREELRKKRLREDEEWIIFLS